MEARIRARVNLALTFFALLFFVAGSSPPRQFVISNAERRIDLSSHIINVHLTLKVENAGTRPASEVVLALTPTEVDHLAMVDASAIKGKRKKTTSLRLEVKPTELPDAPPIDTKYFTIYLANPLNSGESTTLEVLYVFTHFLEPFPAEIAQSESQLVFYHDTALILSPYHIKQQTTFIKTPSTKVESFIRMEPTNRVGTEIKYGPYEDRPPYSISPIHVHFENNSPFAVVEELVQEIEISHWGNIQVTEHYKLIHAGARHKGVFSRVDYQSRQSSNVSSFMIMHLHLKAAFAIIPVEAKSELQIEPRYPLFGGWKATFVIGYGLPLQDFLFESSDDKRYLNFTFGCPLIGMVVDKLTIKVVLPEGSTDPSPVVPFPVEHHLEAKYSSLDVVGRTVVVLEKKNFVPMHNSHFQVYYSFKPIFMLAESLMLASAFFMLFVACVAYIHIDLSVRKLEHTPTP
ncbi:hypothetical protein GOBAR_DD29283 [Gossypium barbadense]|nr:hypothetical protein GOBAR_DD29283 [Gossypium barbadense]